MLYGLIVILYFIALGRGYIMGQKVPLRVCWLMVVLGWFPLLTAAFYWEWILSASEPRIPVWRPLLAGSAVFLGPLVAELRNRLKFGPP